MELSNDLEPPCKQQKLEEDTYFSRPQHFSDVVLIIEEHKFYLHKSTLSRESPVFETMFTSGFKEKQEDEINLPGKKADEFEVFLNIIYHFKPSDDEPEINGKVKYPWEGRGWVLPSFLCHKISP